MKAFTLIEIIMVIALVSILASATTPFLSSFILRNNWQTSGDRVMSELRKAQNYATGGKLISGSSVWGVCLTGNVFRMFNGSCVSPNFYEDYQVPSGVSITGISTVTFGNLRGEPTGPTSIDISSSLGSRTITINSAGSIQLQ